MITISIISFILSGVLLVVSMSLKTLLLSFRVALTAAEKATKQVKKSAVDVGLTSGTKEQSAVGATVENAASAVHKTGQIAGTAVKTTGKAVKTTGKAAKTTVKVGKKLGQMSIKALKLAVRAIQAIINLLHVVITFLLSLGVVGIVILVVIILFLVAAVAGAVFAVGNNSTSGLMFGGSGISGLPGIIQPSGTQPGTVVINPSDSSTLVNACKQVAEWYLGNVTTYSAPSVKWYSCDILPTETKTVGDSCAFFASAYATMVSGVYMCDGSSAQWYMDSSNICNKLLENGWKKYTTTEIGGIAGLQPGDIIVSNASCDPCSKGGHCEVYLGPGQSFGWGSIQTKYPSGSANFIEKVQSNGDTYICTSYNYYGRVYRYVGG